jgi:hypothetical protein
MRTQTSISRLDGETEPEQVPDRHCGRCQRSFEGDPTLFFQTDWALCPECTEILLPGRYTDT